MERTLIHIFILGSISGLTKGNNVLPAGPLNAAEGRNVTFTTTLDPTPTPFQTIIWTSSKSGLIVTSTNAGTTITPAYKDRITLFSSTGSLELRSVSQTDSGSYDVNIINQDGLVFNGRTTLNVQVPVSNVIVTTTSTDLIEFSSVRLSCSSSGSSLSFRWLNDSSVVLAGDRVQISDGGTNLTIVNVTHYDQEPFRCHVSNLVSNGTSDPVKFNISYGPYNVIISGPTKLKKGHYLELNCTAECVPSANYFWMRDGKTILSKSAVLIEEKVEISSTYICAAKNSVTGRSAYGEHHLTVHDDFPVGGIVGIVIACLVVVGVSAGVTYACLKKKKKNTFQTPTDGQ